MTLVPMNARNRINPFAVSTIEPYDTPYGSYEHVELCRDPYCSVCQAQKSNRHRKHHHKRHHHHHHRKHQTSFWDGFIPRVESASSTVTVHNVQFDERRSYRNSPVSDRALVPVNPNDRQLVSTSRTQRVRENEFVREAWTPNHVYDDEIICCRSYNGCRCPCWCCIILIILTVILLIVLIVLLATLL